MFEVLQARGKDFLRRMFDIRIGEFQRALLMQFNIFLLILVLLIIKPVVNAHFLSIVGVDKLPFVFLLVALSALLVSTIYSRLLNRMALGKIIFRTYLTSILGILVFAILLRLEWFDEWIIYVFYIGVALFGLLTTSQFWILANVVFNAMEAKRLFGFIGAGAIAGGVSGGYITSVLAPVMDTANLLFVAVGILVVGMRVNRKIWISFVPAFSHAVQSRQTKSLHEHPIRLIRNSKHLTYLALIMGISVVVAKLVEYQFSAIASARFPDKDELAGFFGFWFSTFNVVSLGIQLLVTQRVVGMFGVGRSLFVLPGALFAGAVAVLIAPVLWTGVALKLFDISLKQSINKAATELLILPIPMAIKSQAKTFIDVFVDTTATGIGGILLIFLINGFDFSVRAVSLLILVLIGVWVYYALKIRKEYILSFQGKLGMSKDPVRRRGLQASDISAVEGLRKALLTGTEKQLLFLLSRIEDSKDQRLMGDTVPLLQNNSASVRQAALRCLYYGDDHTIIDHLIPLLHDLDDEVRYRAFSCILAHSRQNRVKVINDYLTHEDPVINGAALVGLATEARNNAEMQHVFGLEQRVHDKLNYIQLLEDKTLIPSYKVMIARAIGYGKLAAFYPIIQQYVHDEDPGVVENALLAAGNSRDLVFIPKLIHFLPHKSTRPTAQKALSNYEPGELLPVLTEIIQHKELKTDILVQLPALTERMDTQKAIDFLFELVQHRDVAVKLEALQALHVMKGKYPHLTINSNKVMQFLMSEIGLYRNTLALNYTARQTIQSVTESAEILEASNELTNLLERRLDSSLERIFQLLGLKYPPSEILPVYEGIRNRDPDIRMNAVDFLDNILDPNLKNVLIPIVESSMMENMSAEILERLDIEAPDEATCFESLLMGRDDRIKLAVLRLISARKTEGMEPVIQRVSQDENPRVASFAQRMLNMDI